jgi:hypothetical protein
MSEKMILKITQKIKLSFTCATVLFSCISAQADTEKEYWTSFQVTDQYKKDVSLYGEWINRYSQEDKDFVNQAVRFGLIYQIPKNWNYGFLVESRQALSAANDEMRYINQFGRKWNFNKFDLSFRGRWELRNFADTQEFLNRLRAMARLDGAAYKFAGLMPWVSAEYFYAANSAGSRPEGATETRYQLGVAGQIPSASAELSYMNRTVEVPRYRGAAPRTNDYSILNLVIKWKY